MIGTEQSRALQFVGAAGRDPRRGTKFFRDLEGRQGDATTDALNQDIIPGLHPCACDDHPPRGERCQRKRGRLLERDR